CAREGLTSWFAYW
nr:immunoglobulin heavy chain junction region [Mus musculus]MBK4187088.1 immunoglobulin heavy chain junction region [Mus musculus]MBK4196232.1 immunoglobulin heavy chain junction region [Mus musculus]